MRLFIFIIFSIAIIIPQDLFCQQQASKSASKAALMSLLPGLGQAYNKKYWKIPIIYAGLVTSAYFIESNHKKYISYKDAYLIRIDGNPNSIDEYNNQYTDAQLVTLKDHYKRNREISILFISLTYILNIIDASVDAHFFDYEINQDLSLHIQPTIIRQEKNVHGLSLCLKL